MTRSSSSKQLPGEVRRPYVLRAAVGPGLRKLLRVVFVLFGVLLANSVYLLSISAVEAATERPLQSYFYQSMFLLHILLGLMLIGPLVVFGAFHIKAARKLPNYRAKRIGYGLFVTCLVLLGTGVALLRLGGMELKQPTARQVVWIAHVVCPLVAIWLYWLHRLAGPPMRTRMAMGYLGVVGAFVLVMFVLHRNDFGGAAPHEPETVETLRTGQFYPSLAKTATGEAIPAEALMNDQYCVQCHADVHARWSDSVHRFSSFNNPVYRASVMETRRSLMEREGNVLASRFCAGCHDPAPMFSGAFDDPGFEHRDEPSALAGITCTACHAITSIDSNRGNGDFTIEEPTHYPFAFSDNGMLAWMSRQLILARPQMHKRTFLKPLHKTAEFCGACHKVRIPAELNDYRSLPGQDHYNSFVTSGVSGKGARSFYYPPKAHENCNACHMPLQPSADFGARVDGADGVLKVHDHLFPGSNTAIAHLRGRDEIVREHQKFLQTSAEVDIFGLRADGRIDGEHYAPLRPRIPILRPGASYLLEVVIRTKNIGHLLTQGTADSNELWVEVVVKADGRVIGRNGSMDERNQVDPWAHFVNVFMLDRDGNRISRRNVQDIFVPLYNHQIPPGAGATLLYALDVPGDVKEQIEVEARLHYRKFDPQLMDFVAQSEGWKDSDAAQDAKWRTLPVTTLASDRVALPIEGAGATVQNGADIRPLWRRWNDYGIGMLLKGRGALRQAEEAFEEVERFGRYDGPLNLARVYFQEGRLNDAAVKAYQAADMGGEKAPSWTVAWLLGMAQWQQGYIAEAENNLRAALMSRSNEARLRGFDFSRDPVVLNALGQVLFEQARIASDANSPQMSQDYLEEAVQMFDTTLEVDPYNVEAHYNLRLIHERLGQTEKAEEHAQAHALYRADDNARDRAIAKARERYPAADHAAESLVIYPLHGAQSDATANEPNEPVGSSRERP